MPRYIDADALYDNISDLFVEYLAVTSNNEARNIVKSLYKVILDDLVDNAPTVSADEVRGVGKWIPFETRQMDDEEREHWSTQLGYDIPEEEAVIFCSTLPDDGQEVLVCNKWGHVWIDEFQNDPDYGVGLETNGDMDGVLAWMPLPKPMEVSEDA